MASEILDTDDQTLHTRAWHEGSVNQSTQGDGIQRNVPEMSGAKALVCYAGASYELSIAEDVRYETPDEFVPSTKPQWSVRFRFPTECKPCFGIVFVE